MKKILIILILVIVLLVAFCGCNGKLKKYNEGGGYLILEYKAPYDIQRLQAELRADSGEYSTGNWQITQMLINGVQAEDYDVIIKGTVIHFVIATTKTAPDYLLLKISKFGDRQSYLQEFKEVRYNI
jgi:ABC-type amino acid transport system permease subunit